MATLAPPAIAIGSAPAADRVAVSIKAGWATGSIGTIVVLNTTSLLLLFFMTSVLGFGPALAGGLLFGAKLFDAVIAPVLGSYSDRFRSRWGRRRPFLFAGAFVCAAAVLALFAPPFAGGSALVGWMLAGMLLLALGYTLFNVPYLAMPAEMTASPAERTAIMGWRIAFISVGSTVIGFAPEFARRMGGGRDGYAAMGAVLAAIVLASMLAAFFAARRARATVPASRGRAEFAVILANRPFMMILAAKILQLVGLASMFASLLFLFKQVLGLDEKMVGIYVGVSTIVTIVAMAPLAALGRHVPKRTLYVAGCLAFAALKLTWLAASPGDPVWTVLARGALSGLFSGTILLMGQSMIPDAIDWDCRRSGVRREGVYAGAYSFVEKASMALGPLLVGLILAHYGFDPKAAAAGVAQGEQAIGAVYLGAAVLPALCYALSVIPLLLYDLDERTLAAGAR